MGPLELLSTQGVEAIGRYYGVYRAIVINPQDNLNMGKILVNIPMIQSGIQVWASPKSIGGGMGYGFKFLTPPKGEVVWVEFEYGDPSRPVWSYHHWAKGEMPDELKSVNTIGLVTPKGHQIILKEDEDTLLVQLEEGTSIFMDKDKITLNGGENKGVVNVESIRELAKALLKDLMMMGLGTNLTSWMGEHMTKMEDTKLLH